MTSLFLAMGVAFAGRPLAAGADVPLLDDGSAASPALHWSSSPTSGFFRDGALQSIGIASDGLALFRIGNAFPVNPTGVATNSPTYLGAASYLSQGSMNLMPGHLLINGQTQGWGSAACILSVLANPPTPTALSPGCGPNGYSDYPTRMQQGLQDTKAAYFGIYGIPPIARAAALARMGSVTLLNLAGAQQVLGTVVLSVPLGPAQIARINDPSGPIRIAINNGYFGYIIPPGFQTLGLKPVAPVSADGTTIIVDNWVRSLTSADTTVPAAASCPAPNANHIAACPSFAYVSYLSGRPVATAGTGVLPNTVGQTNGSARLANYTVLVGGNDLADALYGGFQISDSDVVSAARFAEIVGVMGKTGPTVWHEENPYLDTVGGKPLLTELIFAGCQTDGGVGTGVCASLLRSTAGIKRTIDCESPQITADEGGTDCILDVASVYGLHSTKTARTTGAGAGWVLYVDPGATGTPRFVVDLDGNISSRSNIQTTAAITAGLLTSSGSSLQGYTSYGIAGIAASGVSEGSAAPITSAIALVTRASPGETALILPAVTIGTPITVINSTAQPISVFPPLGQNFGSSSAHQPWTIPPAAGREGMQGAEIVFTFVAGTMWWAK